ncbi:MAG: hypothetical protein LBO81_05235 [Clostridiales Family XIII bacterium]|nr:hypothetical protein [Clostridiales Family XIII bacterium]
MATIALYSGMINGMPGLIDDLKKSVGEYNAELFSLKNCMLSVNKSVCDLDEVIASVRASTQIQEEKIASLEQLRQNCGNFVADVVRIDGAVADLINRNKENFYSQYGYLRPECEKNGWENICDGLASAAEWCKEHWKLMATVLIVIAAIVLICTGVGGILGAMALGALFGAGIGGMVGGVMSLLSGGSFLEGFENGAFSGAVAGIISGGMGFALSGGSAVALSLGRILAIGGISGAGSSLVSDLGDILLKGEDISWDQVLLNTAASAAFGAAFSGAFYGLSRGVSALKLRFGSSGPDKGPVEFTTPKNNVTNENIAQTRSYVRGCNEALKDGALSPSGRVSTKGSLGFQAHKAARAEKRAAAASGNPYQGNVGHVPDTTWTGTAQPHSWMDLSPSVNKSLGAQALKYPIGYQPTKFVFKSPEFNVLKFQSLWGGSSGSAYSGSGEN